ncbi:MAG: hypothetical protein D6731_16420 [Planctomycetota bacterium]|nr:MAG: hypothetical protein D6731_16420 [Planctomycetota bacterium]
MGPAPQQEDLLDHCLVARSLGLLRGPRWTVAGRALLERLEEALASAANSLGTARRHRVEPHPACRLPSGDRAWGVDLAPGERGLALEAFGRLATALGLRPGVVDRAWGAELHLEDGWGRSWSLASLREDGDAPLRVLFPGPSEAVLAVMLEQRRPWPLWLAPEQVRVLAVGKAQSAAAAQVAERLGRGGVRATAPAPTAPLAGRIRAAHADRVPCIAVVGAREAVAEAVALRTACAGLCPGVLPRETFALALEGAAHFHWNPARVATVAARGLSPRDRQEESHSIP